MTNSSKVRESRFQQQWNKAGAIQSAMTQNILKLDIRLRLPILAQSLFSSLGGRYKEATLQDVIAALKPDLTKQAAKMLGLTSSRVTPHYFRYKVMPAQLGELDSIVTARGFRRIGGIMSVISVHQFPKSERSPNSKLCLAIEVDPNRKDPTLTLAGVGIMGKKPADFAAASNFLKRQPGETRFGALLAHKHLTTFAEMPGVAIELIDCSLQAIWEAVGKR
ncbi:MAG: hypothetical protein WCW67_06145 [Candidatus Margulisiibacteriota bacterium]